jgi:hypothetical protein
MNMPGFTAEMALYEKGVNYEKGAKYRVLRTDRQASGAVEPAK